MKLFLLSTKFPSVSNSSVSVEILIFQNYNIDEFFCRKDLILSMTLYYFFLKTSIVSILTTISLQNLLLSGVRKRFTAQIIFVLIIYSQDFWPSQMINTPKYFPKVYIITYLDIRIGFRWALSFYVMQQILKYRDLIKIYLFYFRKHFFQISCASAEFDYIMCNSNVNTAVIQDNSKFQ